MARRSTDIAAGLNTTAKVQFVSTLGTFSGNIEKAADHDWIAFDAVLGQTYYIFLCLANPGTADGDADFVLCDATGTIVAPPPTIDDAGVGRNALVELTATATGKFYIDVFEHNNDDVGEYSLALLNAPAGFPSIQLTSAADVEEEGGSALVLGGPESDGIGVTGAGALGEQGDEVLRGAGSSDVFWGGIGNDTINGGESDDILMGDAGNDRIFGGDDLDLIYGGAGRDVMTGGLDADTFLYGTTSESRRGALHDVITDFADATDKIDLSDIDAKKGAAANEAFTFIGAARFHERKGELHVVVVDRAGTANDITIVQGDTNGDGKADIEIALNGLHALTATNFDL
jgi:Ca2+-binding RTX toxin-like protein